MEAIDSAVRDKSETELALQYEDDIDDVLAHLAAQAQIWEQADDGKEEDTDDDDKKKSRVTNSSNTADTLWSSKKRRALSHVTELDLGGNDITTKHIEVLTRDILPYLTGLELLDLRHNKLGKVGAAILCQHLSQTAATATTSEQQDDDGRTAAATIGQFDALSCPNLKTLDLTENYIGDEGARSVALMLSSEYRSKTMRNIGLGTNNLSHRSAPVIAAMLRNTSRSLEMVSLEYNTLRDAGVTAIVDGLDGDVLHSLTALNVSDNGIMNQGLAAIRRLVLLHCPKMQNLDISVNKFSGIEAAAMVVDLIRPTPRRSTVAQLNKQTKKSNTIFQQSLQHFDFGCHAFGEKGNALIIDAVRTTTIASLDFTSLDFSVPHAEKLLDILKHNGHVTHVGVENHERIYGTGLYQKLTEMVVTEGRPIPEPSASGDDDTMFAMFTSTITNSASSTKAAALGIMLVAGVACLSVAVAQQRSKKR